MNGKYTILPVFYSNEVNIGSMGSEILRHTVIQRLVAMKSLPPLYKLTATHL